MSNPDTTITPSIDTLITALPVSILFLLITIFLFQLRDSISQFKIILWGILPLLVIIITTLVNITTQYISCKTTNVGKAILGSLPSGLAVLIGLCISSISYCRIPVTSVFVPLFIGKTVDVTKTKTKTLTNINSLKNINSKECCIPKITLESIDSNYPIITGISYGFYIMFSILFGMTIGGSISSIC